MTRKSFRNFGLVLTFAAPLLWTSCKKDDSVGTTTTTTTTTTPTTVTACESASGMEKIVCLADAFKASLSSSQVQTLQLSYSKTDATKWSNFPQALTGASAKRVGLSFGSLSSEQIGLAKALVKELAGSSVANEGWSEIEQILNADDYLKTINANGGYGSENYYISFLGTPASSGTFAILFGGHHLAFQNTYVDGKLAGATPSFRGIEPRGSFTFNGVTNLPLEQESAA